MSAIGNIGDRGFSEGVPITSDVLRPSSWSVSRGKRIFDAILGAFAIVVTAPLMLLAAVIVRATSTGPVIYRQKRLGLGGRAFTLLKFRTMTWAPADRGPQVTRQGDARITRGGRLLRRWKLDELPQFVNVLRGDMSLVGPRPDVPEFRDAIIASQPGLLSLRPGVTGRACIEFVDEEAVLAQAAPENYLDMYRTVLIPRKARADMEYAQHATLASDVALLLVTWAAILK